MIACEKFLFFPEVDFWKMVRVQLEKISKVGGQTLRIDLKTIIAHCKVSKHTSAVCVLIVDR